MSDEIIGTEGQESTQTQEQQGERESLHPAELRKAQRAIKEREKQVADLTARLKELEQGQLSEVEKLRAQLQDLSPVAKEAEELRNFAAARRDAALAALPKDAREKLSDVIEGLSPTKALALIESVQSMAGSAPRDANVPRGSPAPAKRLPTPEQIQNNPSLLDGLSKEELAEIAGQAGVKLGGGRIW